MTYQEFIEYNKTRDQGLYTEKHHIIPKCLGGTDSDDNIIVLSWVAHYYAHILLAKENPDNSRLRRMLTPDLDAWLVRCYKRKFHKRECTKEEREHFSLINTGKNNPMWGKSPWNKGKSISEEHKKKIAETLKGRKPAWTGKSMSEEHKQKLSEAHKGKKYSEETKKKTSESMKQVWAKRRMNAACTEN